MARAGKAVKPISRPQAGKSCVASGCRRIRKSLVRSNAFENIEARIKTLCPIQGDFCPDLAQTHARLATNRHALSRTQDCNMTRAYRSGTRKVVRGFGLRLIPLLHRFGPNAPCPLLAGRGNRRWYQFGDQRPHPGDSARLVSDTRRERRAWIRDGRVSTPTRGRLCTVPLPSSSVTLKVKRSCRRLSNER